MNILNGAMIMLHLFFSPCQQFSATTLDGASLEVTVFGLSPLSAEEISYCLSKDYVENVMESLKREAAPNIIKIRIVAFNTVASANKTPEP